MDTKCNCRELMRKIRETDFAILETALFLDAYPDSQEALSYYCALQKKNEALREEYNMNCGPLTLYSNKSENEWQWTNKPWPWEIDSD